MALQKKKNLKYYFTVEGDTEEYYLNRIKELVNRDPLATRTVSIVCKVQKHPLKYAKSISNLARVDVTHWFDYESDEPVHVNEFKQTLDELKQASKLKQVKYLLGYSNLTFELWMILHKIDCNGSITHREHYLRHVNEAFEEHFTELSTYKEKSNFERVLRKISLEDVKTAIRRAKGIMLRKENNRI